MHNRNTSVGQPSAVHVGGGHGGGMSVSRPVPTNHGGMSVSYPAPSGHAGPISHPSSSGFGSHTVISRALPAPVHHYPHHGIAIHEPHPHMGRPVVVSPHCYERPRYTRNHLAFALLNYANLISLTNSNILELQLLINAYPENRLAFYNLTNPNFNQYVGTSAFNLLNYVNTFPEYSENIFRQITFPINRLREYIHNVDDAGYLVQAFPLHQQDIFNSLILPTNIIPLLIGGDYNNLSKLKLIFPLQQFVLSQYDNPIVVMRPGF